MSMLSQPASKYRAFDAVQLTDRTWPNAKLLKAPVWLSTDMRDGNQALIEPMDRARKLRMFETLVDIGFKEIEVGFPASSQLEFDLVRGLIDDQLIPADVTIQVMTPAKEDLIRRTFDAATGARRAIIHLYNATAPMMRKVVLGLDEDGIVDLAVRHAQLIKDLADQRPQTQWVFQYSPEMFSDTELPFAKRVVDAVTAVWQASAERPCIINLPTTVERCTPNVFADMIEWMHRHLARRDGIVLSVHPHNDRGTGTAAAELAMMAGAQRVEGCLFGNGERTGNLDVVNVALNLYTQGVSPGLDFSDIDNVRRVVEHCNQLPVHPRHPYVGDLVYTSFSGTHQDAIKKAFSARADGDVWDMPYLPIDPKDLGRSYDAVIRVNSQSGKGGMAYLLESERGLKLPRRLQIEFASQVQAVMDAQTQERELSADDLWAIFEREYQLNSASIDQQTLVEQADGRVALSATLHSDGRVHRVQGLGAGPVQAFVDAVQKVSGTAIQVLDYHEHAIGGGAQARAAAYMELRIGDTRTLFGVGIDANILTASMKAVLSGLTRAGVEFAAPRFGSMNAHQPTPSESVLPSSSNDPHEELTT